MTGTDNRLGHVSLSKNESAITSPLKTIADAIFNINKRNPIDASPPKGPWLETRRQGPTLRNLAIPNDAENTERLNVVINKNSFS